LCLERASLWDFVVLLLLYLSFLLFFFLITGCWLESSVRVFSFFREVFVLFSFKFRTSFAPRRVASCPFYTMLGRFLGLGRNYRTCIIMSTREDIDMQLFENQTFSRFFDAGFHLATSWKERFRYSLYY
jgi:hypothetical protein